MKLSDVILEAKFQTYTGMVRVRYKDEVTTQDVAELIRASSGVTIVSTAGHDEVRDTATLRIKLVSKKGPLEAFKALKARVLRKIPVITAFEIGEKTITTN
jgi:hypothetical protein